MGKWHGSCSSDEAIEHALPQRGVRMESSVYQRARQEWDERYATGQRTRAGPQSTPAFGDNAFCSDCVADDAVRCEALSFITVIGTRRLTRWLTLWGGRQAAVDAVSVDKPRCGGHQNQTTFS